MRARAWPCPAALAALAFLAGPAAPQGAALPVAAPPDALRERLGLSPFYRKHVAAGPLPLLSSERASDHALREAAELVTRVLEGRDDLLWAIAGARVRVAVMSVGELTCDVPEHSDLRPRRWFDRRHRGLGATPARPALSVGEENLLGGPGDPWAGESTLIHELAHAVHELGLPGLDPEFDGRLRQAYAAAMKAGLWEGTYASTDAREYWAEGVQGWFDANREGDAEHGRVNTRAELRAHDAGLARLLEGVFGDRAWRWRPPAARPAGERRHLPGFDPAGAPRFAWPQALADERALDPTLDDDLQPLPRLRVSRPGGRVASPRSEVATRVVFVNPGPTDVRLCWVGFQGELQERARLRPGRAWLQDTYDGHVWAFLGLERDRLLGLVTAGPAPSQAILEPPAPPPRLTLERAAPAAGSPKGAAATWLVIVNRRAEPVRVEWATFEGGWRQYAELRPGQRRVQSTYAGHVWRFTAATGAVLGFATAVAAEAEVRLEPEDGGLPALDLAPRDAKAPRVSVSRRATGTEVTFVNRTALPVTIEWLDFQGEARVYATLQPGQSRRQPTWPGHAWVVTPRGGEPLVVVADEAPGQAIVGP